MATAKGVQTFDLGRQRMEEAWVPVFDGSLGSDMVKNANIRGLAPKPTRHEIRALKSSVARENYIFCAQLTMDVTAMARSFVCESSCHLYRKSKGALSERPACPG